MFRKIGNPQLISNRIYYKFHLLSIMIYEYFTVNRWTQLTTTFIFSSIAYMSHIFSVLGLVFICSSMPYYFPFIWHSRNVAASSRKQSVSLSHIFSQFLPPPSILSHCYLPCVSFRTYLRLLINLPFFAYCFSSYILPLFYCDTKHIVWYLSVAVLSNYILSSLRDVSWIINLCILM